MTKQLQIFQERIDDQHLDSMWYDGIIASMGKYRLVASGEIRIYLNDEDGNYLGMYDGKAHDEFPEPENDADLHKIYESEDGYVLDMNNWFEVIDDEGDCVGDICDDYDDGINWLKELAKEDTK